MLSIIKAEGILLWHRRTSRLFLLLSGALAICMTLFFQFIISGEASSLSDNLNRMLGLRNFFVLPLLFMLCSATSIAEDRQIGIMKEALCQPISRSQYLLGKMLVLTVLAGLSLLITSVPPLLFYNGDLGTISNSLLAYPLALFSDVLLIEITFLVSTFARSSGTAAIYTFFFFVGEAILRLLMNTSKILFDSNHLLYDLGPQIAQWMPGATIGAWKVWEDSWFWGYPIGLFLLIGIVGAILNRRFSQLEL